MLVVSCLCDVPDPLGWLVVALVLDPQVPHPQSAASEHGHLQSQWESYLEVERDGRLIPQLLSFQSCGLDLGAHEELVVALELLDPPHDCVLVWLILGLAGSSGVNLAGCGVVGHGDLGDHVAGEVGPLEDGFDLDGVLNAVLICELLHYWHDLEGQIDVLADTVGHQLEDTVGRDERDRTVPVELSQPHALVELDVVDLDALVHLGRSLLGVFDEQFVVDAKLALGHAAQGCLD